MHHIHIQFFKSERTGTVCKMLFLYFALVANITFSYMYKHFITSFSIKFLIKKIIGLYNIYICTYLSDWLVKTFWKATYFNILFFAKYIVIPMTEDVVAIQATLVAPIFSPHNQPFGRQLTAWTMSKQSFPATTVCKVNLTSKFFLAIALPSSEVFWRQSRLHHNWRIERDVLRRKRNCKSFAIKQRKLRLIYFYIARIYVFI